MKPAGPVLDLSPLTASWIRSLLPEITKLKMLAAGERSTSVSLPMGSPTPLRVWNRLILEVELDQRLVVGAFDDNGSLVGVVTIRFSECPGASHRGEIHDLFVRPEARNRGIGRALLQCAESESQKRGCLLLIADARTGSACEKFFKRQGHVPVGTIPIFEPYTEGELGASTLFHRRLDQPVTEGLRCSMAESNSPVSETRR